MMKYTLEMTDDKAEEIVAAFDEMVSSGYGRIIRGGL
jgi:hypothetical protein